MSRINEDVLPLKDIVASKVSDLESVSIRHDTRLRCLEHDYRMMLSNVKLAAYPSRVVAVLLACMAIS